MLCSTIREILVNTEKVYGPEDAIRYKIKKNISPCSTCNEMWLNA